MPKPKHDSPEERLARNESIATFEDLEGLNEEDLSAVATECLVDEMDPDSCVPCRAITMIIDRAPDLDLAVDSETGETYSDVPDGVDVEAVAKWEEGLPTPVEQIANMVAQLNVFLDDLIDGPPIPPRDVSLEDLAVLTFAAKKWSESLDLQVSQGFSLSEQQMAAKSRVDALTARFNRG